MRYCKDCEHFNTRAEGPPYCGRFKKEFIASEHPVFGARVQFSAPDCATARGEKGQCGPQARFWCPRPGTEPWLEMRSDEMRAAAPPPVKAGSWFDRVMTALGSELRRAVHPKCHSQDGNRG